MIQELGIHKNFSGTIACPASAGSGKTEILVYRYVQLLLLAHPKKEPLNNILAITFTELAAKEMKERIIRILKLSALQIKNRDDDEFSVDMILALIAGITPEEAALRSASILETIFSDYSDFNVRTIDSFVVSIFSALAFELQVSPQSEISFDEDAVIENALRSLSGTLHSSPGQLEIMRRVVGIIEEMTGPKESYPWNPFSKISNQLCKVQQKVSMYGKTPICIAENGRLQSITSDLADTAEAFTGYLSASGLETIANYIKRLEKIRNGDAISVAESKLLAGTPQSLKKPKTKKAEEQQQKIIKDVLQKEEEIDRLLLGLIEETSRTYYQPYVQVYHEILPLIKKTMRANGVMALGEAYRLLRDHSKSGFADEVYMKLSERISHFLIDEYQDTSPLQVRTLFPLVEDALAKGGSLFAVGDMKQSIFGFRGADWHEFHKLLNRQYYSAWELDVIHLTENKRSGGVLVNYVKDIFNRKISEAALQSYAAGSMLFDFKQNADDNKLDEGFVAVKKIAVKDADGNNGEEAPAAADEKEYLISIIKDCKERGFTFGEIAILTPANNDVLEIGRWLNESRWPDDKGIPFLSFSNLDIRKRKIVNDILALLQFLDSPVDNLPFTVFLRGEIGRSVSGNSFDVDEFILACCSGRKKYFYSAFKENFPAVWNTYFEKLFNYTGYLPVYDLVSEIYKIFGLLTNSRWKSEEAVLVKFIDCVKEFEGRGNNNLKEFLVFSEEESDGEWSVEAPESADAVRIMTVHKSKGLGFPVSIIIYREKRERPDGSIYITEEEDGLLVSKILKNYGLRSDALKEVYDAKAKENVTSKLHSIYVALTRAKNEMYLIITEKEKKNKPEDAGKEAEVKTPSFLQGALFEETELGKKYVLRERTIKAEERLEPLYRTVSSAQTEIRKKPSGFDQMKRGDVIHEALASIEFLSGEAVVSSAYGLAKIPAGIDAAEVVKTTDAFLAAEQFRKYFRRSPGRIVHREKEIADNNGRLYRVDRLIIDPDMITVVDFKTGEDQLSEKYHAQTAEYVHLLREIFPAKNISAMLLYVDLLKEVIVL